MLLFMTSLYKLQRLRQIVDQLEIKTPLRQSSNDKTLFVDTVPFAPVVPAEDTNTFAQQILDFCNTHNLKAQADRVISLMNR